MESAGGGAEEETTDKMDLRVNWDGHQQHLCSGVVHWIKWEKRGGHMSGGRAGGDFGQVSRAFTLTLGTSRMLMGGPQIPLVRDRENGCFCEQDLPSRL